MSHPIEAKNFLDRAIEAVAPGYAAGRYAARMQIEMARAVPMSTYRGAIATRGSKSWGNSTSFRGGSQKDRRDLGTMRDRGRRVFRENAIGRSLLNTETDNVMAEGFTLQMNSSSPDFNKEAEDRFYAWMDRADVAGKATGAKLFRMSWKEPRKDGDGGFILSTVRGYPRLQYVPGDLIRNPYKGYDPRTMFDGVECDPAGRPVRFWIRDVDEMGKDTSTPIDARDFVYIAHLDDPMAVRGSTVYGPIFELLDQIDTYRDAVTKASIMACIFGLIEKRKNPAAALAGLQLQQNAAGEMQKAVTYESGSLKIIGTEDSVFQVNASQPMQQTPEFMRALSRVAALGFEMPLEVALRDLSQVNFAGGQLGLKGYERTCRVMQDESKSVCWNRIGYWWLSIERRRQELGYDDAFVTPFPADYGKFEFHAREWLLRDRLGEAKADLMEISIGVSSPQRACAQRSVDYKEIRNERKEAWEANRADDLPNLLPVDTRDATTKVTAVDADGNPLNQNAPFNGVQATSAMEVLTRVTENTLPVGAAQEMLERLGMAADRAKALVSEAVAARGKISVGDRTFQREMLLKLMDVPQAREAVYNATDVEDLIAQAGLPPEKGYQAPFAALVAPAGQLLSGALITGPDGVIVGGDVENDAPADGEAKGGGTRNASPDAAKEAGQGQDEQGGGEQAGADAGGDAKPAGAGGGGA